MRREEIKEFIKPYGLLVNFLESRFKYEVAMQDNCPIMDVSSRVKMIDSVLNKLLKKELTIYEMEKLTDIAGIRLVVRFKEDIPKVCQLIRDCGIKIIEERDYINKVKKKSGYRAYHFILEEKGMFVEIQIRTFAMDTWANLEHDIRYKPTSLVTDEMEMKLASTVKYAHEVDEIASFLYKESLKLTKDDGTLEMLRVLTAEDKYNVLVNKMFSLILEMRMIMLNIGEELSKNEYT